MKTNRGCCGSGCPDCPFRPPSTRGVFVYITKLHKLRWSLSSRSWLHFFLLLQHGQWTFKWDQAETRFLIPQRLQYPQENEFTLWTTCYLHTTLSLKIIQNSVMRHLICFLVKSLMLNSLKQETLPIGVVLTRVLEWLGRYTLNEVHAQLHENFSWYCWHRNY